MRTLWPFAIAYSLLELVLTFLAFRGDRFTFIDTFVFISVLVIAVSNWWRDLAVTDKSDNNIRLGIILFIVSEVIVFFGLFWAYFQVSLSPTSWIGVIWPPISVNAISPWGLPLLNTLLLLTSGASLTWAHYSILISSYPSESNTICKNQGAVRGLFITILLALLFTSLQVYEYLHAGFNRSDSVYGTRFYALTGIHGLHVIIGTIFLIVIIYRISKGRITKNSVGFDCAAWYWHFVDVVWLFLFLSLYR